MCTLLLDIGNTATKVALANDIDNVHTFHRDVAMSEVVSYAAQHDVKRCVVCKVAKYGDEIIDALKRNNIDIHIVTAQSKLNFVCKYGTPNTLGADRIAAIAAAIDICPDRPLLVIDAGTAITYDFVTREHTYVGGNIAPGMRLRFETLHNYTSQLPLCSASDYKSPIGDDTKSAIAAGITNGLRSELMYYEELAKNTLGDDFAIILGGGDYNFFALQTKNSIFASQNLALHGLRVLSERN